MLRSLLLLLCFLWLCILQPCHFEVLLSLKLLSFNYKLASKVSTSHNTSYTAFLLGAVVVSPSQEAQKAVSLIFDDVNVQVQVVYPLGFALLYGVYHKAEITSAHVLTVPVQVVYPHPLVS